MGTVHTAAALGCAGLGRSDAGVQVASALHWATPASSSEPTPRAQSAGWPPAAAQGEAEVAQGQAEQFPFDVLAMAQELNEAPWAGDWPAAPLGGAAWPGAPWRAASEEGGGASRGGGSAAPSGSAGSGGLGGTQRSCWSQATAGVASVGSGTQGSQRRGGTSDGGSGTSSVPVLQQAPAASRGSPRCFEPEVAEPGLGGRGGGGALGAAAPSAAAAAPAAQREEPHFEGIIHGWLQQYSDFQRVVADCGSPERPGWPGRPAAAAAPAGAAGVSDDDVEEELRRIKRDLGLELGPCGIGASIAPSSSSACRPHELLPSAGLEGAFPHAWPGSHDSLFPGFTPNSPVPMMPLLGSIDGRYSDILQLSLGTSVASSSTQSDGLRAIFQSLQRVDPPRSAEDQGRHSLGGLDKQGQDGSACRDAESSDKLLERIRALEGEVQRLATEGGGGLGIQPSTLKAQGLLLSATRAAAISSISGDAPDAARTIRADPARVSAASSSHMPIPVPTPAVDKSLQESLLGSLLSSTASSIFGPGPEAHEAQAEHLVAQLATSSREIRPEPPPAPRPRLPSESFGTPEGDQAGAETPASPTAPRGDAGSRSSTCSPDPAAPAAGTLDAQGGDGHQPSAAAAPPAHSGGPADESAGPALHSPARGDRRGVLPPDQGGSEAPALPTAEATVTAPSAVDAEVEAAQQSPQRISCDRPGVRARDAATSPVLAPVPSRSVAVGTACAPAREEAPQQQGRREEESVARQRPLATSSSGPLPRREVATPAPCAAAQQHYAGSRPCPEAGNEDARPMQGPGSFRGVASERRWGAAPGGGLFAAEGRGRHVEGLALRTARPQLWPGLGGGGAGLSGAPWPDGRAGAMAQQEFPRGWGGPSEDSGQRGGGQVAAAAAAEESLLLRAYEVYRQQQLDLACAP